MIYTYYDARTLPPYRRDHVRYTIDMLLAQGSEVYEDVARRCWVVTPPSVTMLPTTAQPWDYEFDHPRAGDVYHVEYADGAATETLHLIEDCGDHFKCLTSDGLDGIVGRQRLLDGVRSKSPVAVLPQRK